MTRRALTCVAALAVILAASSASASGQSAQPHVVGGQNVSTDDFPWQAAVLPGNYLCGGSLVTSRIVLTAAHCVYGTDPDCPGLPCINDPGGDGTPRVDPGEVDVILGRTTLSSGAGTVHGVIDVAYQGDEPLEMPAYDMGNPPRNDVGYLVLSDATPTAPGDQIKIAAPGEEEALWDPGVFADITGWGTTSQGGSTSNTLRGASVPIVSSASCTGSYGGSFNSTSMICAGYQQGGVDTCQGDSGGPLQSPLLDPPGGYRLVGITSWGIGCAQPNRPGVYARVADTTLRDAIAAKVAQLETDNSLLPHENPVGDGLAEPRGGITFPLPQPPVNQPFVPTTTSTAKPKDPFAKCRKIGRKNKKKRLSKAKRKKQKRKRKRCMRKVRAAI